MQIVDIHPHVISHDTERYPLAPLGGKQSAWSEQRPADTEELLRQMDDAGIERAVVVQAATAYGSDNSYLADSVEKHGDRLAGVGCVDIAADGAVGQLRYWTVERNLVGIRLYTSGTTMPGQATWFTEPRCAPAWSYLEEHAIPVCFQMRPPGLLLLGQVLESYPALPAIVDNAARVDMTGGRPFAAAAPLFALAALPTVHVKVTTNTLRRATKEAGSASDFVGELVAAFGSERVAWGSDYPAMEGSLVEFVDLAHEALSGLSEPEREDVLARTAERLYRPAEASN